MGVKQPISYTVPRRRDALLQIRRMIVDEGLSHNEIQLKLNLPPSTYFRYLDLLFEAERDMVAGNITANELLNETIILREKYMRRSKKVEEIINYKEADTEAKVKAHHLGAELDKAAHPLLYEAPAYLASREKLPSLTTTTTTAAGQEEEEK